MLFQSSHGDIFYRILGPDQAITIAFVHGIFADHRMFEKIADEFSQEHRVILWDMPDHGKSARLNRGFDFSTTAECFNELLDETGVDRVVLVGVSLGGVVSQYIASRYPERTIGTAVEGAFPLHENLKAVSFGFFLYSLMVRIVPWKFLMKLFRNMTANMDIDDEVKTYMDGIFLDLDKQRFLQLLQGTGKGIRKGIEKPVQQPVLITNGDSEMFLIRRMNARWHESKPNSVHVEIPGAMHGSLFFNPEKYNHALRSFLGTLG